MLVINPTPPLTTPVDEQERLQKFLDYRREEIAAGFDTRDLEEDSDHEIR